MMTNPNNIAERTWLLIIGIVSVLVVGLVAFLLFQSQETQNSVASGIYILPKLNAIINSLTFILLLTGFFFIKKGKMKQHQTCMTGAFAMSILFLVSYLAYHSMAPHTSYGGAGADKYLYYFILITHILLAIAVVPLALITLFRAFKMDYAKHKKVARWTLPIWLYVSLTGVLVYLMISPYYPV